MKRKQMIKKHLSIVVPFFNPPYEAFQACLQSIRKLDVLTLLRLLYRKERFSVHPTINYIYNDIPNSIQTSKPRHYHRLRHIQTVARFCQLENLSPEQSEYFLQLAMLNFRYGAKSRNMLKKHTNLLVQA
jgi:hypothetical protein